LTNGPEFAFVHPSCFNGTELRCSGSAKRRQRSLHAVVMIAARRGRDRTGIGARIAHGAALASASLDPVLAPGRARRNATSRTQARLVEERAAPRASLRSPVHRAGQAGQEQAGRVSGPRKRRVWCRQ